MCGRFTLAPPEPTLRELIGPADWSVTYTPRWNVAPGQDVLAVTEDVSGRRVDAVRWGIPGPEGRPIVNARVETAAMRAPFRRAFAEGRCVVPADAFYEWQGKGGQPYRVAAADGRVVGLAAIRSEAAGGLVILTREAVPSLAGIHSRMPVMLDAAAWRAWLGGAEGEALAGLVERVPALRHHPVSRRVNSVLHDDPECAREAPVEPRQMSLW